jgi:outer membrane protein TolC
MSPKTPIPIRPKPPDAEVEEQIRQRAYQLYEKRGRVDGNDMDDWLIAEREVLGSRQAKAAAASS